MPLLQQIDDQLKDAMRAKDLDTANVLRMLKSAVKYAAIENGGASTVPSDEVIVSLIRKEIKKRQESIDSFSKAGRADVAAKEEAEKKLLETFLPAALSEAEIEGIVRDAMVETGASSKAQMGAVMKVATAKAAGRVDGKTLSALVQKLLS
ncbi:MAG: GatB/YqeY domain-containing protein [Blastochloris sp.]|nr:GatB/YqeY domain-containing protein [Blastochloris sp.]